MRAVNGAPQGNARAWGNGVYVMMHPHPWLAKHPPMIQCTKEYVRASRSAASG
jgi:hypothetical protein